MAKSAPVSVHAESFLAGLALRRRLSPHTVAAYRRDLALLIRAAKDAPPNAVSAETLRRALARDAALGKHPATAARRLSAWRVFFDHLVENGLAETNPARGLRPPKRPARLPKALTPDETAKLLDATDAARTPEISKLSKFPNGKKGGGGGSEAERAALRLRDAAMFELLYSSALRVGELVALDLADVDWRGGFARVLRGKGGRGRVAPVGKTAMAALQKWRTARALFAKPNGTGLDSNLDSDSGPGPGSNSDSGLEGAGSGALFISRGGGRLGARTVQMRLGAQAKLAGMPGRVSPHVLRHSCASHFLQSSGDLRATQELLGHRDIAATQIYTRLDFQNLAAVYDRAHPRARKAESGRTAE